MAILIPNRRIEIPQMVKLFSNPVSGIACMMDPKSNYNLAHGGYYHIRNIRYSKSMLIKALEFWRDKLFNYYLKVTRITDPLNPTIDSAQSIDRAVDDIQNKINIVTELPDSFLFSHRHIREIDMNKYSQGMKVQLKLLVEKYKTIFKFQWIKVDPYYHLKTTTGIEFTVFPNEHPYIQRSEIAEVGETSAGNVFIIKK